MVGLHKLAGLLTLSAGFTTVLGIAGCAKKGDQARASMASKSDSAPASGQSRGRIEDHFTSRTPALPGPFAAVRLGIAKADLAAAVPQFAADGEYFRTPELPEVSYYAHLSKAGQLESLRVGLPRDRARPLLTAAWGEPTELKERKGVVLVWVHPETRLRAALEDDMEPTRSTLVLQSYTPIASLIATDSKQRWGFEPSPFLGKTADEVKTLAGAGFQQAMDTLTFLQWPATEWDEQFQVEVSMNQGKAERLQLWLHHGGNPKVQAEMLALLETKYGRKASEQKAEYTGRKVLLVSESPRVEVADVNGSSWVVEISAASADATAAN